MLFCSYYCCCYHNANQYDYYYYCDHQYYFLFVFLLVVEGVMMIVMIIPMFAVTVVLTAIGLHSVHVTYCYCFTLSLRIFFYYVHSCGCLFFIHSHDKGQGFCISWRFCGWFSFPCSCFATSLIRAYQASLRMIPGTSYSCCSSHCPMGTAHLSAWHMDLSKWF